MIRRPPRSTQSRSSAASDVYKRQFILNINWHYIPGQSGTILWLLTSFVLIYVSYYLYYSSNRVSHQKRFFFFFFFFSKIHVPPLAAPFRTGWQPSTASTTPRFRHWCCPRRVTLPLGTSSSTRTTPSWSLTAQRFFTGATETRRVGCSCRSEGIPYSLRIAYE